MSIKDTIFKTKISSHICTKLGNTCNIIGFFLIGFVFFKMLQSSIYTTLAHYFYAFVGITDECIYKGFIVIKSCLIMISI